MDSSSTSLRIRVREWVVVIVKYLIIALIIVTPIRYFVARPFIVSGASMEPTFDTNEYLVIDQVSYRFHTPERGDSIVFKYPLDPSIFFVKRVVGLPGETVQVSHGLVSITPAGTSTAYTLDEPYLVFDHVSKDVAPTELGRDEYFVLGDNRDVSSDSRVWGPLQEKFIVGRPVFRLYPFSKMEFLPGQYRSTSSD